MNRVLIHESELGPGGEVRLTGRRSLHIRKVLGATVGQTIRVGVLNGATGQGVIREAGEEAVLLECALDAAPPPRSRVDLLLALPRPKVMKRLWAPLASLGVGRLILTNAAKVERNYFDTHWLSREYYEPLLVEGLEQSGDTWMPEVTIGRRFRPMVEDDLDGLAPRSRRLVAHPGAAGGMNGVAVGSDERLLLAIGPEGGWTDFELDLLERHAFRRIGMGWRRLRSDTACVALLALAHERLERGSGHDAGAAE